MKLFGNALKMPPHRTACFKGFVRHPIVFNLNNQKRNMAIINLLHLAYCNQRVRALARSVCVMIMEQTFWAARVGRS
jgi:hypothetical protein